MPGQMVSAGVCLESFVVATTDSNFSPQFVDRTGSQRWNTRVCGHRLRLLLMIGTAHRCWSEDPLFAEVWRELRFGCSSTF